MGKIEREISSIELSLLNFKDALEGEISMINKVTLNMVQKVYSDIYKYLEISGRKWKIFTELVELVLNRFESIHEELDKGLFNKMIRKNIPQFKEQKEDIEQAKKLLEKLKELNSL